ncbi:MAG: hypothetical protein HY458_02080 [Parcubacteria group bacterium]|nr:hypothetical protein [Parcubacteria group bacterium]
MLIEFYGKECPHCIKMMPLAERLEKDTGLKVEKYEVWHNEENAKKMEGHNKGRCGGVPFFINTDTDAIICGEAPYEELKKWAGVE